MDNTDKVLIEMLQENTGAHFLDSGGAYGRNYERNQGKDFVNLPPIVLHIEDKKYFSVTRSLFHFLSNALCYEEKIDKQFQKFAEQEEFEDADWSEILERFVADVLKEDSEHYQAIASYGTDNNLDQDFQFTMGENGIGFLRIHGGCDIRGGWTTPRVFSEREEGEIFGIGNGTLACNTCQALWDTDDGGYHWHPEGENNHKYYNGTIRGLDLEKYNLQINDTEILCPVCSKGKLIPIAH